jgi:hypothetical protein
VNKQKPQNSILVLATLGVYLGLVLVGATPQAVAQRAAMARSFDISDEIEAKDDLDKKPDDEVYGCSDGVSQEHAQAIVDLYAHALSRYVDTVSPAKDLDATVGGQLPTLDAQLNNGSDSIFMTVCGDLQTKLVELTLSQRGLDAGIEVLPLVPPFDRSKFFDSVAGAIDSRRSGSPGDPRTDQIIRHTSLSMYSDRLFISTCLPRADLDSLLASNAK